MELNLLAEGQKPCKNSKNHLKPDKSGGRLELFSAPDHIAPGHHAVFIHLG